MGVDGLGLAEAAPGRSTPLNFRPKLTLQMVARLQGFPDQWKFAGKKTAAYRQIGNAFPPPFAAAVGSAICSALTRDIGSSESAAKAAELQLVSG